MKRPTIKDVPDRYCSKCGALLVNKEVHSSFDIDTGKDLSHVISTCPNRRWYNIGHDRVIRKYRHLTKGKIEWIE